VQKNEGRVDWRMMAVPVAALVVGIVAWSFFADAGDSNQPLPEAPATTQPQAEAGRPSDPPAGAKPAEAGAPPATKPTLTLAQIAARAKTWEPAYEQYVGKPSPEIAARDLGGNPVKLSDYKGRNVLVVFWATWCPPCKEEIPSLIKLRKTMSEDKLAIIAISADRMSDDPVANNTMMPELIAMLKTFSKRYNINYTVVTMPSHMDEPFASVNILPTAFFISPEGNMKFIVQGMAPLKDIEAILAAEK
jgi:thiol-disulfide isomerase/thioredoxin